MTKELDSNHEKKIKGTGRCVVDYLVPDPNIPGAGGAVMKFDPDAISFEDLRVTIPEEELHPDAKRVYGEGIGWIVKALEERDKLPMHKVFFNYFKTRFF